MQVYMRPPYGTLSYKEYLVILPSNAQKIANVLPQLPTEFLQVTFCVKENDEKNYE